MLYIIITTDELLNGTIETTTASIYKAESRIREIKDELANTEQEKARIEGKYNILVNFADIFEKSDVAIKNVIISEGGKIDLCFNISVRQFLRTAEIERIPRASWDPLKNGAE